MAKTFSGTTENQQGELLQAEFWKTGTVIQGKVTGEFPTQNGICYNVLLEKPAEINGKKDVDRVIIGGNLRGLLMALKDAKIPDAHLLAGDAVMIQCTGTTPARSDERSDMLNFKIAVSRP